MPIVTMALGLPGSWSITLVWEITAPGRLLPSGYDSIDGKSHEIANKLDSTGDLSL